MVKLIIVFLSLNFMIAFPVYSMEEQETNLPIQDTNLVLTEVSPDKKSASITLRDINPIKISFASPQGLTFETSSIPTRLTNPEPLGTEKNVQQEIEAYYIQSQGNNIIINLIGIPFRQNYGKEVYCQDFKEGRRNIFVNTYHLIKNDGYGHFNNYQSYNNVMLCFANSTCKLTLAPSCQPVRNTPSTPLVNLIEDFLYNHQTGDAYNNTLEKGKVFSSIELTPAQEGFSSGWLQGNIDFKEGVFNLFLQGVKAKINLEPSIPYKFLEEER